MPGRIAEAAAPHYCCVSGIGLSLQFPVSMRHFLFDFDGTITRRELLPEIGKACGLEREIAELTSLTIAGVIPFQTSLERRVELLRRVPISDVRRIVDEIPRHEEIVRFIGEHPDRCHIVTGNLDVWVGPACRRIARSLFCSRADAEGDRLNGLLEVLDKSIVARDFSAPFVAVGEGHSDAGMIEAAEVGIAFGAIHEPADSVSEVCSHKIYDEARLCRFLRQLS